jgi:hypothetical protein
MNSKLKTVFLWFFAFLFTAALAIYQRRTGPTYPVHGEVTINNQLIKYQLIRTYEGEDDAKVTFLVADTAVKGEIQYRRFRSYDSWVTIPLTRSGDTLIGALPHLPPAGKIMYQVTLKSSDQKILLNERPAVLRYKGAVPLYVLIPHIIIIFLAMFFSTVAGLEAIFKRKMVYPITWLTVIFLFVGGMILGPVIQKFAFDAYWTGWPFGHDLTDNKSLVALIFWIIALVQLYKNHEKRTWAIVASVVMLVVFLIPHSMLGSEIDYTKDKTELPK